MEDNFNKHLGNKLKLRRLALGLTQTKVAKAINVTFQQIQKYEKGTNGVSSIRLLQLSNYLKVPINYFFEDFSEYLINCFIIRFIGNVAEWLRRGLQILVSRFDSGRYLQKKELFSSKKKVSFDFYIPR